MSRVRLFVALELPDEVVDALVAWRAPLVREHVALRPLAAEALHATLCFLGWQEEEAIAPVTAQVEAAAGEACSVPGLTLGEALWLPPRGPRVLAVRLADGTEALCALQRSLAERLAAGGWYEPEVRPYLPHVTVARVRGDGTAGLRRAALPAIPRLRFGGTAVTLYRSRLHPSGARYSPLSRNGLA